MAKEKVKFAGFCEPVINVIFPKRLEISWPDVPQKGFSSMEHVERKAPLEHKHTNMKLHKECEGQVPLAIHPITARRLSDRLHFMATSWLHWLWDWIRGSVSSKASLDIVTELQAKIHLQLSRLQPITLMLEI